MPPSNMTVADVRKALSALRAAWEDHSPSAPMNTSDTLFNGMHASEFAYLFVFSHHEKRHRKS